MLPHPAGKRLPVQVLGDSARSILFNCNRLSSSFIGLLRREKRLQQYARVAVDADGLPLDRPGANSLPAVQTGIYCVWILRGHLPKRIFDDARGVVSDADLPKENVHAIVAVQKIRIPASGFPPAFVFGKTVVRTQVHRHGLSAFRAPRDQRGGDAHVFLFFHHAQDKGPVIIGLPVTRLAALEQTVIALCVKQPFFIKTRFLKTVVHIGREYKIIFFGYEPVQRIVNGLGASS